MNALKRESDASSDSSSASSSSSDTVLIAKPLNQKHRKKLQAQLQAQQEEHPPTTARAPASVGDSSATVGTTAPAHERASGKSDLICLVCEQDGGLLQCTGPCVSAFHIKCLGLEAAPSARESWKCPSCASSTHVCFHCKRLGASVTADASSAPPGPTPATTPSAASITTAITGSTNSEELRPVRKCRALSCGKFYHSDCIAKLPLARIAGANFICPLHTCAACEQSGAKKESVRCMRCPVAYHTSCLPRNCVQNYPGKRIICPKHRSGASRKSGGASSASRDAQVVTSSVEERNTSNSGASTLKPSALVAHEPNSKMRRASEFTSRSSEDPKSDTGDVATKAEAHESSSSSARKREKSAKREKKKKKKSKRKKAKKRERGHSHDDDDDDGGDGDNKRNNDNVDAELAAAAPVKSESDAVASGAVRMHDDLRIDTRADGNDGDDDDADAFRLPPLNVAVPEVVSPATSSSLFESPATTNERIKARLVEALGQSDDDLESDGSPIALPTPSVVKVEGSSSSNGGTGAAEPDAIGTATARSLGADTATSASNSSVDHVKHEVASPMPSPSPTASAHGDTVAAGLQHPPMFTAASGAADDNNNVDAVSRSDSASQLSGEKAESKSERKARAASAKDLSHEFSNAVVAGTAALDRRSSSKKPKLEPTGLSVHIPESPSEPLQSLRGDALSASTATQRRSEKDSVSEGEEGDDEGPGGASTPTLRRRTSTGGTGTPRGSGDSAADDHKAKVARASKSKKKKKRGKSEASIDAAVSGGETLTASGGGEELGPDKDEAKWVQCDSCKKWRTVPKAIDLNAMPERWYCKMNTWDAAFASCAVAEEVAGTEAKKPKSSHSSNSGSKRSKVKASKTRIADAHPAPTQTQSQTLLASAVSATTGTGSDGGNSSPSSSGAGSTTSKTAAAAAAMADVAAAAVDESSERSKLLAKKQEKQAKKRKLKLKLKEKYREVKWVQCEGAQCGKWRVVPSSIDFSLLPTVWYCHLNTWSPEIANCAAPNPPEVEAFLSKSHSKKSASAERRPSKKLKPAGDTAAGGSAPDGTIAAASAGTAATASGTTAGGSASSDAAPRPTKPAKAPKGGVNPPASAIAHHHIGVPSASDSGGATMSSSSALPGPSSTGGASAATPSTSSGSNTTGTSTSTNNTNAFTGAGAAGSSSTSTSSGSKSRKAKPDGIKKTVLEWAQCEKCNKWRKLPQHIKSSTLPDKWFCSMNHWDPARASCAMPEEADQEPLSASPLPSAQTWYPMPGQVTGANGGAGGSSVRSKRSKLSYTELLYASTGQLRKTYTSESSTHTFELDGRVYRRDDQYKDSSMYVSPDSLMSVKASGKQPPPPAGGSVGSAPSSSNANRSGTGARSPPSGDTVDDLARLAAANPLSVEHVAALVLDAMDLRRSCTVVELFHATSAQQRKRADAPLSLALVAAAVQQLESQGLIEPQDSGDTESDEHGSGGSGGGDADAVAVAGRKRRRSTANALATALSSARQYRKVPKRPLKASKCWRLGAAIAWEFPLQE